MLVLMLMLFLVLMLMLFFGVDVVGVVLHAVVFIVYVVDDMVNGVADDVVDVAIHNNIFAMMMLLLLS